MWILIIRDFAQFCVFLRSSYAGFLVLHLLGGRKTSWLFAWDSSCLSAVQVCLIENDAWELFHFIFAEDCCCLCVLIVDNIFNFFDVGKQFFLRSSNRCETAV